VTDHLRCAPVEYLRSYLQNHGRRCPSCCSCTFVISSSYFATASPFTDEKKKTVKLAAFRLIEAGIEYNPSMECQSPAFRFGLLLGGLSLSLYSPHSRATGSEQNRGSSFRCVIKRNSGVTWGGPYPPYFFFHARASELGSHDIAASVLTCAAKVHISTPPYVTALTRALVRRITWPGG
jgi:hypothetical protein